MIETIFAEVRYINIKPTIVVIIEQRHPGAWRLQNGLFFGSSRPMAESVDAGCMGHINKNDWCAVNKATGCDWSRKCVLHRSVRPARAHAALLALGCFFWRILLGQSGIQKQRCTNGLHCGCTEKAPR